MVYTFNKNYFMIETGIRNISFNTLTREDKEIFSERKCSSGSVVKDGDYQLFKVDKCGYLKGISIFFNSRTTLPPPNTSNECMIYIKVHSNNLVVYSQQINITDYKGEYFVGFPGTQIFITKDEVYRIEFRLRYPEPSIEYLFKTLVNTVKGNEELVWSNSVNDGNKGVLYHSIFMSGLSDKIPKTEREIRYIKMEEEAKKRAAEKEQERIEAEIVKKKEEEARQKAEEDARKLREKQIKNGNYVIRDNKIEINTGVTTDIISLNKQFYNSSEPIIINYYYKLKNISDWIFLSKYEEETNSLDIIMWRLIDYESDQLELSETTSSYVNGTKYNYPFETGYYFVGYFSKRNNGIIALEPMKFIEGNKIINLDVKSIDYNDDITININSKLIEKKDWLTVCYYNEVIKDFQLVLWDYINNRGKLKLKELLYSNTANDFVPLKKGYYVINYHRKQSSYIDDSEIFYVKNNYEFVFNCEYDSMNNSNKLDVHYENKYYTENDYICLVDSDSFNIINKVKIDKYKGSIQMNLSKLYPDIYIVCYSTNNMITYYDIINIESPNIKVSETHKPNVKMIDDGKYNDLSLEFTYENIPKLSNIYLVVYNSTNMYYYKIKKEYGKCLLSNTCDDFSCIGNVNDKNLKKNKYDYGLIYFDNEGEMHKLNKFKTKLIISGSDYFKVKKNEVINDKFNYIRQYIVDIEDGVNSIVLYSMSNNGDMYVYNNGICTNVIKNKMVGNVRVTNGTRLYFVSSSSTTHSNVICFMDVINEGKIDVYDDNKNIYLLIRNLPDEKVTLKCNDLINDTEIFLGTNLILTNKNELVKINKCNLTEDTTLKFTLLLYGTNIEINSLVAELTN